MADEKGETMWFFGQTANHSNSTQFLEVGGGIAVGNNDARAAAPLAQAVTITTMQVRTLNAPGTGESYTFTLYKNGSATGLSASVTGSANTAIIDIGVDILLGGRHMVPATGRIGQRGA
jgi:hypothetical protein